MMRSIVAVMGMLIVLAVLPLSAMAKGVAGIANTMHNMSKTTSSPYNASDEDEICIFCHTPHGGSLDGPLWNREMDDTASSNPLAANIAAPGYFTHYDSSTLGATAGDTARAVSTESLLCLSCHDGTIAVNRVINLSNRTPQLDATEPTERIRMNDQWVTIKEIGFPDPLAPGAWIGSSRDRLFNMIYNVGGDLSDDHPISFSYDAAYLDDPSGLDTTVNAAGKNVRFFGATNRVECSSCHDPHVDYGKYGTNAGDPAYTVYTPFLITPNTGSALCKACHVK
ncbi:MAG: hypothetical protein C0621_02525 [Desulfuromonas sp.]|nr:MAG: hypothetical protein C0621_02525 [Desulfuromonas sp.]